MVSNCSSVLVYLDTLIYQESVLAFTSSLENLSRILKLLPSRILKLLPPTEAYSAPLLHGVERQRGKSSSSAADIQWTKNNVGDFDSTFLNNLMAGLPHQHTLLRARHCQLLLQTGGHRLPICGGGPR